MFFHYDVIVAFYILYVIVCQQNYLYRLTFYLRNFVKSVVSVILFKMGHIIFLDLHHFISIIDGLKSDILKFIDVLLACVVTKALFMECK